MFDLFGHRMSTEWTEFVFNDYLYELIIRNQIYFIIHSIQWYLNWIQSYFLKRWANMPSLLMNRFLIINVWLLFRRTEWKVLLTGCYTTPSANSAQRGPNGSIDLSFRDRKQDNNQLIQRCSRVSAEEFLFIFSI